MWPGCSDSGTTALCSQHIFVPLTRWAVHGPPVSPSNGHGSQGASLDCLWLEEDSGMSPVRAIYIPQSKLSDVSRNRKAKISREGMKGRPQPVQILLLPKGVLAFVSIPPQGAQSASSAQPFPHGPLPPAVVLMTSSWRKTDLLPAPSISQGTDPLRDHHSSLSLLQGGHVRIGSGWVLPPAGDVSTFNEFSLDHNLYYLGLI